MAEMHGSRLRGILAAVSEGKECYGHPIATANHALALGIILGADK